MVDGNNSIVTGNNNVIKGNNNKVTGNNSNVKGNNNLINGNNTCVVGNNNKQNGNNCFATGQGNVAIGLNCQVNTLLASEPSQSTVTNFSTSFCKVLNLNDSNCKNILRAASVDVNSDDDDDNASYVSDKKHQPVLTPGNRGEWNPQKTYIAGDIITLQDNKYVSLVADNTAYNPSLPKNNTRWALVAVVSNKQQMPNKDSVSIKFQVPAEEAGEPTTDESRQCIVCLNNRVNTIVLMCGHLILCVPCSRKFADESSNKLCPSCGIKMERIIRSY